MSREPYSTRDHFDQDLLRIEKHLRDDDPDLIGILKSGITVLSILAQCVADVADALHVANRERGRE